MRNTYEAVDELLYDLKYGGNSETEFRSEGGYTLLVIDSRLKCWRTVGMNEYLVGIPATAMWERF